MIWARMLAYITGTVDQELLLTNEYLAAQNRILRAQIKGRLLLSDAEKATLPEIAHRLGRKTLQELAAIAKPDTLLAWYRKLIADKFDVWLANCYFSSHWWSLTLKAFATASIFGWECVQERQTCSVEGGRPTGAKVRSPLAWVASVEKTKRMKPTDKAILS